MHASLSRIEAVSPVFLPINPSGVAYPQSFDVYTVLIVANFPKCWVQVTVAYSLVQYSYPFCNV